MAKNRIKKYLRNKTIKKKFRRTRKRSNRLSKNKTRKQKGGTSRLFKTATLATLGAAAAGETPFSKRPGNSLASRGSPKFPVGKKAVGQFGIRPDRLLTAQPGEATWSQSLGFGEDEVGTFLGAKKDMNAAISASNIQMGVLKGVNGYRYDVNQVNTLTALALKTVNERKESAEQTFSDRIPEEVKFVSHGTLLTLLGYGTITAIDAYAGGSASVLSWVASKMVNVYVGSRLTKLVAEKTVETAAEGVSGIPKLIAERIVDSIRPWLPSEDFGWRPLKAYTPWNLYLIRNDPDAMHEFYENLKPKIGKLQDKLADEMITVLKNEQETLEMKQRHSFARQRVYQVELDSARTDFKAIRQKERDGTVLLKETINVVGVDKDGKIIDSRTKMDPKTNTQITLNYNDVFSAKRLVKLTSAVDRITSLLQAAKSFDIYKETKERIGAVFDKVGAATYAANSVRNREIDDKMRDVLHFEEPVVGEHSDLLDFACDIAIKFPTIEFRVNQFKQCYANSRINKGPVDHCAMPVDELDALESLIEIFEDEVKVAEIQKLQKSVLTLNDKLRKFVATAIEDFGKGGQHRETRYEDFVRQIEGNAVLNTETMIGTMNIKMLDILKVFYDTFGFAESVANGVTNITMIIIGMFLSQAISYQLGIPRMFDTLKRVQLSMRIMFWERQLNKEIGKIKSHEDKINGVLDLVPKTEENAVKLSATNIESATNMLLSHLTKTTLITAYYEPDFIPVTRKTKLNNRKTKLNNMYTRYYWDTFSHLTTGYIREFNNMFQDNDNQKQRLKTLLLNIDIKGWGVKPIDIEMIERMMEICNTALGKSDQTKYISDKLKESMNISYMRLLYNPTPDPYAVPDLGGDATSGRVPDDNEACILLKIQQLLGDDEVDFYLDNVDKREFKLTLDFYNKLKDIKYGWCGTPECPGGWTHNAAMEGSPRDSTSQPGASTAPPASQHMSGELKTREEMFEKFRKDVVAELNVKSLIASDAWIEWFQMAIYEICKIEQNRDQFSIEVDNMHDNYKEIWGNWLVEVNAAMETLDEEIPKLQRVVVDPGKVNIDEVSTIIVNIYQNLNNIEDLFNFKNNIPIPPPDNKTKTDRDALYSRYISKYCQRINGLINELLQKTGWNIEANFGNKNEIVDTATVNILKKWMKNDESQPKGLMFGLSEWTGGNSYISPLLKNSKELVDELGLKNNNDTKLWQSPNRPGIWGHTKKGDEYAKMSMLSERIQNGRKRQIKTAVQAATELTELADDLLKSEGNNPSQKLVKMMGVSEEKLKEFCRNSAGDRVDRLSNKLEELRVQQAKLNIQTETTYWGKRDKEAALTEALHKARDQKEIRTEAKLLNKFMGVISQITTIRERLENKFRDGNPCKDALIESYSKAVVAAFQSMKGSLIGDLIHTRLQEFVTEGNYDIFFGFLDLNDDLLSYQKNTKTYEKIMNKYTGIHGGWTLNIDNLPNILEFYCIELSQKSRNNLGFSAPKGGTKKKKSNKKKNTRRKRP